jgi:glutamate-ammonia-ligase adenylyltransferase
VKPTLDVLKAACPDVDEGSLQAFLARLNKRYFRTFDESEQYEHARGLARLTPEHPVEVLIRARRDGSVACTVLAFDYPSLFSLITGVLAGVGFSIVSGDVFTYSRMSGKASQYHHRRRSLGLPARGDMASRRRIVDCFSGEVTSSLSFTRWAEELRARLEQIFVLLEDGGTSALEKVKLRVNEMVVKHLARLQYDPHASPSPVDIQVDNDKGPFTRLNVVSVDTPAFLYALTNALSLQGISIEQLRIRTIGNRISDEIDIVDRRGNKIEDPDVLNRVRLSVLLTKEFTYFLGKAPSPYDALVRFEALVQDVLRLPERGRWLDLLSNPHALKDLARLLGASDFLWEDFIRVQHEALLPTLRPFLEGRRLSETAEKLPHRLKEALEGAGTKEDQRKRLNAFKDREIFLIDLDHILNTETDFAVLARRLVRLAECVINQAAELAYNDLIQRFGRPTTAAGLEARFAVFGLGKLGGAALGYASDIEFLLVYSDSGTTDGKQAISNAEFFERLVQETTLFVEAKQEGIFHIDLRLRPYGNDGPLASSLDGFCRYYGREGASHSYERLALVRLRAIGGDRGLGARVERIRDELIYASKSVDLKELRALRDKQFVEKTDGGKLNAKFSPGGLVDLEYAIQMLQVMYGKDRHELRTPRTHDALAALSRAGLLSGEEGLQLVRAYDFLRDLINAMRMLRGSARDLFLPPFDSDEFGHLARRMGYERGAGALDSPNRLRVDLETYMAAVRAFVDRHFGREALPGPAAGTMADVILSDGMPPELSRKILSDAGFRDPVRAYVNLRSLAGNELRRQTFARLALVASDILLRTSDPDMALNNWERYVRTVPSIDFHYSMLLSQPMRLEILLTIFSSSQFLADTLVRYPGLLDWVTMPENLQRRKKRQELEEELRMASSGCRTQAEWLNKLRRFRRREILRIGTRDMYLGVSTEIVMAELSILAEAMIQGVLEKVWANVKAENRTLGDGSRLDDYFCVLAMGKLGGRELNYSSDIDLIGVADMAGLLEDVPNTDQVDLRDVFATVMERTRADLSSSTEEGCGYRVDLRLRPYGGAGDLVPSMTGLMEYYEKTASLWEVQAALKMRPVAGNLQVGRIFLKGLRGFLLMRRSRDTIVSSIEKMRQASIKACSPRGKGHCTDIKCGIGGLRDVEFLVQGLQLIHAPDHPELLGGNTLAVLEVLRQVGVLPADIVTGLHEDYLFLRRTEHYLQILEDRQTHSLPTVTKEMTALAKRILGFNAAAEDLTEDLERRQSRIRTAYRNHLLEAR